MSVRHCQQICDWDTSTHDGPQHLSSQCVPIPAVTFGCKKKCCERTCIPLELSFARTIDTFQGQTAGPTEPGKPPNDAERVILDPGNRSFEARKPGLFFTMFSRGSTIGKLVDGKRVGSAVYFHDFGLSRNPTLAEERIAKLRTPHNKPNNTYDAIQRRDRWMNHLESNRHGINETEEEIQDILRWARTPRIPPEESRQWLATQARSSVSDVP